MGCLEDASPEASLIQDLVSHEVFNRRPQGEDGASLEMKAAHCVGYPFRRIAVLSRLL